ncbi:diaminopimelate decarboxylase family protein [Dactylosporangium sp. CS-047395]|uniref:diaminopimelate decarboxylase family protein n=1 Tax=Dactylosporangium sp. CS-047395 TaxID=3239936 RepID=UPI003D92B49B
MSADLRIGDVGLAEVAETYGTPLYVLDEAAVRDRCRAYLAAFGAGNVAYTGKALLTSGVAHWIAGEGLGLYVGSAGEIRVALAGGTNPARMVLYGSAKTPEDLNTAYGARVGTIVAESMSDITRLAATAPRGQRVLLRVGGDGTAGLAADTGELAAAVARLAGQPGLRFAGFDCSIGHDIGHSRRYEQEIRRLADLCGRLRGVTVDVLNLGGGHSDHDFALDAFADRMRTTLRCAFAHHDVPIPRLTVSPGRAVVARAGITLYRVLTVTTSPDGHLTVTTDGGLTDCPAVECADRHRAMLIARRSVAPVVPATVLGRHNDPADVVVPAADLPADVHPGDLLAISATGAYHHARASNYHLVPRPPLVAVAHGRARPLIRRETQHDLLARDCGR